MVYKIEAITIPQVGVFQYLLNLPTSFEKIATSILPQGSNFPHGKSDKRKIEFLAGRYVLASLLDKLGVKATVDVDGSYGFLRLKDPYHNSIFEKYYITLSHTNVLAVCALGCRPIGIDVEEMGRSINSLEKLFSIEEVNSAEKFIDSCCKQVLSPFLVLWIAKEAFVKATGLGIRNGFSEIKICYEEKPFLSLMSTNSGPFKLYNASVLIYEYDSHIVAICSEKEYLQLGVRFHFF